MKKNNLIKDKDKINSNLFIYSDLFYNIEYVYSVYGHSVSRKNLLFFILNTFNDEEYYICRVSSYCTDEFFNAFLDHFYVYILIYEDECKIIMLTIIIV